jgi:hypothetical protein
VIRGCWARRWNPQLADFPAEVARVGLAQGLGLPGEQPDQEIGTAEVAVTETLEPGPDLGFDLDLVQARHASHGICIGCYRQRQVPT